MKCSNKGFTMIELIFVIVILGILAAAIPKLEQASKEAAELQAQPAPTKDANWNNSTTTGWN